MSTTTHHMRMNPTHWAPLLCEELLCLCCELVVQVTFFFPGSLLNSKRRLFVMTIMMIRRLVSSLLSFEADSYSKVSDGSTPDWELIDVGAFAGRENWYSWRVELVKFQERWIICSQGHRSHQRWKRKVFVDWSVKTFEDSSRKFKEIELGYGHSCISEWDPYCFLYIGYRLCPSSL
jgi:hypothetical protein